jgi:dihydropteroate synthase
MGICNVTPDSFSDGGRYLAVDAARARVDELLAEGADIVDVGGESTRPGAPPVAPAEQLARVLEVVRYAASRGACVSVDTASPEVAASCLDAGAHVINDVSCLRDEGLAEVAAATGAALVLMHARGTPAEMNALASYDDVVFAVVNEWDAAAARAMRLGVPPAALVMDPGLGFAKTAEQSAALLRATADIVRAVGVSVLVGASRKSFLKLADATSDAAHRLGASVAAALFAARAGAAIVRVHDVAVTRQALDMEHVLDRGPLADGPSTDMHSSARGGG